MAAVLLATATCAWADEYRWKNVTVTGGGFISGIVSHPKAPGLRYVRTDVGGAYRWDAGTSRWLPLTEWIDQGQWTLTGIESIGLDPSDPERVYLAAGSYTNHWSGNGAVLLSADRGTTWRVVKMPFKFGANERGRSNGERLAVDPSDGKQLWLGTRRDGLWRSRDRGETWTKVETFPIAEDSAGVGIVAILFPPARGEVWAVASSPSAALWRSVDDGATWTVVDGQPAGFVPHHAEFEADGTLWVTYGNDAGPNGLTLGAVWKRMPSGEWLDVTPLRPSDSDRFGYAGLSLDRRAPGTVVVTTLCRWAKHDEMFRTTDGGRTWKPLFREAKHDEAGVAFLRWGRPQVDPGHWIGDVDIDPANPDGALYVTGMTLWGTDNLTAADRDQSTHWRVAAQGIEELVVNELISPPEGAPLLSAVWDVDGFRHDDLDVSPSRGFFQPAFGHNTGIDFAQRKPGLVVRVSRKAGAFSEDGGKRWTPFAATESGGDGRVAVSADGSTWVWAIGKGAPLWTGDRGTTWTPCAGLSAGVRVVSDRVEPARFTAWEQRSRTVLESADGGRTFATSGAAPAKDGDLRAVPGRAGELWIAGREGLCRSSDFGASWVTVDATVSASRVGFGRSAQEGGYPTLFVAGTMNGAYGIHRSVDEGRTWQRVSPEGLGFGLLKALAGDPRVFGRVYVGTGGRGMYYGEPVP